MYGTLYSVGLIISIILVIHLFTLSKVKIGKYLIYGTILIAFWIAMEALSYYWHDITVATILQKAKYFGIMLLPPVYVALIYEFEHKSKLSRRQWLLLMSVPFLNMVSLITNKFPYPFFSSAHVFYQNDIPVFSYEAKLGFVIHTIYSYTNILYVCHIFFKRAITLPKLYRKQSRFIFIGSLLAFFVNLLAITTKYNSAYIDFTSICMLTTIFLLYWGIFRLPKATLVPLARELLVENIKDSAFCVDLSGRIIYCNPAALQLLKQFKKNSMSKELLEVELAEALDFIPEIHLLLEELEGHQEKMIEFSDGEKNYFYRIYQKMISDPINQVIGKIYMLNDVTQLQNYLLQLQDLNGQLMISERILSSAMEGILITNNQGGIIRVNEAFERMSGYLKEELIGNNPRILKSFRHNDQFYTKMWGDIIEKGSWEGEIWDRKKDGEIYPKYMSITSLKEEEGSVEYYIAISIDLSNIKRAEENLHILAYYDSLTGIPNRSMFYERLEWAIIKAKDKRKMVALLFMDLDGFKVINDSLGHATGDKLLKEVADRIRNCIHNSDTVSRIGGDEFTVILENITDIDYVKEVAEEIIQAIMVTYTVHDREINLGVSIGIAIAPDDETSVEGLVRKADAAMYDAKEAGKGRYSFSSEEIEKRNHEILEMQIRLKKALENSEFKLYLQPQIAFINQQWKIAGAEALIRWQASDGQIFTPDKFIPLAETNGMIIPLGEWVLEEIFRMDHILKENDIRIKLAINVSSRQLETDGFVTKLKELYQRPERNIDLEIEVTESFLLYDLEKAISTLQAIRNMGINIALDDFGTGYSSLSYLTRLPIDYLKIDKSFIQDIHLPKKKSLVANIISMARTLDLKIIAEGVETKEQALQLLEDQCDVLQGYYFSKPIEITELTRYVKAFQPHTELTHSSEELLIRKD